MDQSPAPETVDGTRNDGKEDNLVSEELKLLRRKRGRQLAAFSRLCNRADAIIDSRDSRTRLAGMLETIDAALEGVIAASDSLEACLSSPNDKREAEEYTAKVEADRKAIGDRIARYLTERRDEPPSEAGSCVSAAQRSSASAASKATQVEAEVTAKMKALRLQQTRRRQDQERSEEGEVTRQEEARLRQEEVRLRQEEARRRQEVEKNRYERELRRKRQLQDAEDEAEAAQLEVQLRRNLSVDLQEERREDFASERLDRHQDGFDDRCLTVSRGKDMSPSKPARSEEARKNDSTVDLAASKERDTATWIQALSPPQHVQQPDKTPTFSAFAKSIPRLNLPTFDGKASDWPRWIGLFKALVHDQPSLSDTEKIAHLQSSVSGLAQQTIAGMLYDGSLYHEALQTLEERFGQNDDIIRYNLNSIFDAPNPLEDDAESLEKFQATLHCAVTILKNMGSTADLHSSDSLQRVAEKLPKELKREWGKFALELKPARPSLLDVDSWLKTQVKISRCCPSSTTRTEDSSHRQRKGHAVETARRRAFTTAAKSSPPPTCYVCTEEHDLEQCQTFRKKAPDTRLKIVFDERLCLHCLKKGHRVKDCRKAKQCGKDGCKYRHHALLHDSQPAPPRGRENTTPKWRVTTEETSNEQNRRLNEEDRVVAAASYQRADRDPVTLLQVVPVRIHGRNGTRDTFALLDPGAQTSLCTTDLVDQLDIPGKSQELCVQTVEGAGRKQRAKKMVMELTGLSSAATKNKVTVPEVWAVPSLNISLPKVSQQQRAKWQHLTDLEIPDCASREVELLLGANVLEAVIQHEVRAGRAGQPVAVRTDFGWALTGAVHGLISEPLRQIMHIQRHTTAEELLSEQVKAWWSTEAFGTKYSETVARSTEDSKALMLLEENTRKVNGRYRTGLLWKEPDFTFPDNKSQALQRLHATERRLNRLPEVAMKYQATIDAYIADGHARKLTSEEATAPNPRRWFLPHHAVMNPNKPDKVRVVFDAAASYRGTSLNERLMTGPDLLQSLPGVLLRFREDPVAIAADIKQMYHQIEITEEDRPAASFLWRDLDSDRPPEVHQMEVLIFGARSSPAIANYVLRKALRDSWQEEAVMLGAKAEDIQRSFYMDDFLLSTESVEGAGKLKDEATRALAEGGFELAKWRSNKNEIMKGTADRDPADTDETLCLSASSDRAEKTLGVVWNESEDTLGFRLRDINEPLTKRGVLSRAAAVFDPLGIVSPFTVQARIMIQRLWARQLSWDEPLPEPELTIWKEWLRESMSLPDITIPRSAVPERDIRRRELHVFCDASETAFGAVVYLRTTANDGTHECRFLIAKNRVAPLKKLSIVRLELQAAVLGARLAEATVTELSKRPDATYFWSDSKVVLQYLANESRRFHTFVANRVAEVKDLTEGATWLHVPGKLNPADDASRGLPASELTPKSRWLSGPAFLHHAQEDWPEQATLPPVTEESEEVKPLVLTTAVQDAPQPEPDPSRFSSWLKHRRVVAWMKRFVHNATSGHAGHTRRSGPLSSEELSEAERCILQQVQRAAYAEEIASLAAGRALSAKSGLLPLSPFLDESGLLRVGGRLENAPVPQNTRHPVILPRHGAVTRLVILQEHSQNGHAGVEQTLNGTRHKYWVVKGRAAVKQTLKGCPTCRRQQTQPKPPMMASLPTERFDSSRPFSTTGIDIFGPMYVKRYRRTEKRYGLLATCMATRAIHLEVVHSLDADSTIMALRRLFARRGRPAALFSDNGANFVGSCRELRAQLRAMEKELAEKLSAFEVDWRFNPPAASHMGGVWERMVRSVKTALKTVVGRQTLTDEVLVTVFAEVEHMINSRPLTHVSSDPADPEALTPNHFLLGGASRHLAPGLVGDRDMCSRRRWKHAQAMAEHVWRRWTKEYVPTLIQRSKWQKEQRNLQEGDLVLMAESNLSRGYRPLARITRVFPAADGRVRSAELRTAGGKLYTRPAVKICLLEEECK